ncbi:fetuin B isoform X2 [Gouania willdenowi]|uniref:fetuin B isoform X2 n=1 Tax=Gouania willdenowi TaxID=441366 RepID=UPI00105455F0|nr:histidine-rich glycoprotein-like isoform X2 [Gouania willdenowi]
MSRASPELTMKTPVLLCVLLALACVHVRAAPLEDGSVQPGSCEDGSAKGAAKLALDKINQDRTEGYVFNLHRLSNVHMQFHGEAGVVFYLTLDVVETNCSVLNKDHAKICETRQDSNVPVYGQCKATIYISKIHRVVRLYKYDCVIRPVPGSMIHRICPDCPNLISNEDDNIQKTVALALESFNKENKLNNHFTLLKVNRASAGFGMGMYYLVEFTIQETTCDKSVFPAIKCPKMECEFAHKGFCKGSRVNMPQGETVSVECDIFEPEAADREKKLHMLGGETDHAHKDGATADHDHAHDQAHSAADHAHDHVHDHTKSHTAHETTHQHAADSDHHHTHDHAPGSAHKHAHDHSHDHSHSHDHVHAHHAKAHNHEGDHPNQHHNYTHITDVHTHDHDHELALDHDHKHAHLHVHEHHHHHHEHEHETTVHDHPEGSVRMLPAMDPNTPMVLPAFPDTPAAGPPVVGVTLELKQDPQIPGVTEPTIEAFPGKLSAQCPTPVAGERILEKVFAEDAIFKVTA